MLDLEARQIGDKLKYGKSLVAYDPAKALGVTRSNLYPGGGGGGGGGAVDYGKWSDGRRLCVNAPDCSVSTHHRFDYPLGCACAVVVRGRDIDSTGE